jgi:hypothetical protein
VLRKRSEKEKIQNIRKGFGNHMARFTKPLQNHRFGPECDRGSTGTDTTMKRRGPDRERDPLTTSIPDIPTENPLHSGYPKRQITGLEKNYWIMII